MTGGEEIVRVGNEIETLLLLPCAEATRRLAELYRIENRKEMFVLALIGRLMVQVHGACR